MFIHDTVFEDYLLPDKQTMDEIFSFDEEEWIVRRGMSPSNTLRDN